jgi:hypothetical protein
VSATLQKRTGPGATTCREIVFGDLNQVVELLWTGFAAERDRSFWRRAIKRLAERAPPAGYPRFGYVLESEGRLVGVLLVIASEFAEVGRSSIRCNVSGWYVAPEFRPYAPMLAQKVLRWREATYVNISAVKHTWPVLTAQGCIAFARGCAIALPWLARSRSPATIMLAPADLCPGHDLSAAEVKLLGDHARWGCLSLLCDAGTHWLPFVFRRHLWRGAVPVADLIYCRNLDTLAEFAGPIGRFLARRGLILMRAHVEAAMLGMPNYYLDRHRMFFKGPHPPRPGDLAYTERAVFGS